MLQLLLYITIINTMIINSLVTSAHSVDYITLSPSLLRFERDTMLKKSKFVLLLLFSVILSACGGSGGSNDAVEVPPQTVVPAPDTVAPTITLISGDITLTVGDTYEELGATVTDNVDVNLTASISGSVDTSQAGTYVLTYSASDAAGNTSSVTRTVTVEALPDTEAPVITLIGDAVINLLVGETYQEQGVSITDNVDTNLIATISGAVDTNVANSYTLVYTAVDTAGNEASVSRTVVIAQDSSPTEGTDAYIFHSENDDSYFVEYWGDTWDTATVYTDQSSDTTYSKSLEISKSSSWGTVVAWGNEPENTINITSYTHAKFKVKSDTFTAVQVFVQSATQAEMNVVYSIASGTDLGNGWTEIQATLPDFTDMTWIALNFMGDAGTTVFLADLYFTTLDDEPVTGPPTEAPNPPSYADDEVIVLYSDSLTQDSFIGVWNANWWNAPIYSEGDIGGNHFAKYEITAGGIEGGVTGLEFGYENGPLDASTKTTWNFDLYIEAGISKVEVQLVSADGGAKYTMENPTVGEWVSYALLFNELVDNDGAGSGVLTSSVLESIGIQLWGAEGQSVYVDNIYFSGSSVAYDLTVAVVDDNNSPVANATVEVGNISVATDAAGQATMNLSEGEYRVTANANGFGIAQSNKVIEGGDTSLTIRLAPLNTGPSVAADAPTASNEEAFVLYSDALTVDKAISFWNDNWWNAPTYSEIRIGNDNVARFQIIPDGVEGGVTGIQYGIQGGVVDASQATGLRFDLYATVGITQAVYQVVSASGPGISTMSPVPTEQWITVELPFSALVDSTGNFNPATLSQFGLQLWGTTSDSVYIDNIYFY